MSLLEEQFTESKPLYSKTAALNEANRCLECYDAPCTKACPAEIDIPRFIKQIASEDLIGASRTIFKANPLGLSCASSCPVEVLCAGACVYNQTDNPPIQIGRLQRYATEHVTRHKKSSEFFTVQPNSNPKQIALVGGGPACLTTAVLLRQAGHQVTLFEKEPYLGGLNTYGIAPYKLKTKQSQQEIDWLLDLGIQTKLSCEISIQTIETLCHDYDAVVLGVGLGKDKNLVQFSGPGVYGALELIQAIKSKPGFNLNGAKSAVVLGGGNTAIDIAHELKLLGLEQVTMAYRKSLEHLSAYRHEMDSARKDGVQIRGHLVPMNVIHQNNQLKQVVFESQSIDCDLLVTATGRCHEPEFQSYLDFLKLDSKTGQSKHPKIWAVGDLINGGKEVVDSVASAKQVTEHLIRYLDRNKNA